MSLFVTGVLGNEVEVFAADDDGAVHLGADNGAGEDTAADRDHAGEGALLVYTPIVSTCSSTMLSHDSPRAYSRVYPYEVIAYQCSARQSHSWAS